MVLKMFIFWMEDCKPGNKNITLTLKNYWKINNKHKEKLNNMKWQESFIEILKIFK